MMSPRDALRSYRRAFKRAYLQGRVPKVGRNEDTTDPKHPLMVEMGRRGDRLRAVYGRKLDDLDWPAIVFDAMTTRDLRELEHMDAEPNDSPF